MMNKFFEAVGLFACFFIVAGAVIGIVSYIESYRIERTQNYIEREKYWDKFYQDMGDCEMIEVDRMTTWKMVVTATFKDGNGQFRYMQLHRNDFASEYIKTFRLRNQNTIGRIHPITWKEKPK
jgi:hypothetical protein